MSNYKEIKPYYEKYVDKILKETEGCSDRFKVERSIFSSFNILSIFFPEAYQYMLKEWEVSDEDN